MDPAIFIIEKMVNTLNKLCSSLTYILTGFVIYFDLPKPSSLWLKAWLAYTNKSNQMCVYYGFQPKTLQSNKVTTIYLSLICA